MKLIIFIALIVLNLIILYRGDSYRNEKMDIRLVNSITGFAVEVMASSCLLLFYNHFSIIKAVFAVSIVNIIAGILFEFVFNKRRPKLFTKETSLDLISAIIVLIGVAFALRKSGVPLNGIESTYYELHALKLSSGIWESHYNGSPAYPSLLAVGGYIGGLKAIMGITSIWTVMFGIYVSDLCDIFDLKKFSKYVVLAISLLSPVTIAGGKCASHYLFIGVLLLVVIREITIAIKNHTTSAYAVIALVGIMFMTIKILFFMPLIIACFLVMYAHTDKKEYLYTLPVIVFLNACVITVLHKVAAIYMRNSWWSRVVGMSTTKEPLSQDMQKVILIAYFIFTLVLLIPTAYKTIKSIFTDNGILKAGGGIGILVVILSLCKMLFMYYREIPAEATHESLFALCVNTGLVLVPLGILYPIVRDIKKPVSGKLAIITLTFVYGLLIGTAGEVSYIGTVGFYGLQMLIPFIPLGLILGILFIGEDKKWKKIGLTISVAFLIPFSLFAAVYRPNTYIAFEDINNLAKEIEARGNVVYLYPEMEAFRPYLEDLTDVEYRYMDSEMLGGEEYVLSLSPDNMDSMEYAINAGYSQIIVNNNPGMHFFEYYPAIVKTPFTQTTVTVFFGHGGVVR